MFLSVPLGSLITAILLETAKSLGGKVAAEFLMKRIKQKFKKKHKVDIEKEGVTFKDLEQFRAILQEELLSYGIKKKEIDFLILKGIQKLSSEHDILLHKMENIEGLLTKLTASLHYEAFLSGSDVPREMNDKLFEQFILGEKSAENTIREYIDDDHYSQKFGGSLVRYVPVQQAYIAEDALVKRFLEHFDRESDQIDQLALFTELWALIGSKTASNSRILKGIVVEILQKSEYAFNIDISNMLRFLYLLDLTNSLDLVDSRTRALIIDFLKKNLTDAPYYKQIEICYYLMKFEDKTPELITTVETALNKLSSQKFSNKFVKESTFISKRILNYFQKQTDVNVNRSVRVLQSLVKKFEKRSFERSTALLEGQLTRTLSETNILATKISEKFDDESLGALKRALLDLVCRLLQVSDKPRISHEHRILVWKIIDNCVYILNKVAITNAVTTLDNWEVNLAKKNGIYSEDWGEYRKKSREEIEKMLKDFKVTKAFIEKAELEQRKTQAEELPEPPKEKTRKLIREKS